METYNLKDDVNVLYVKAKKFPEGIMQAFKTLENLDPSICERPFYGISYEDKNGKVI
ncbi:MAG: hypothetical protein K2X86_00055 [Cytophagaceae bacterium]|nr:hypothetical protein [Cytophagaceae bacterium]